MNRGLKETSDSFKTSAQKIAFTLSSMFKTTLASNEVARNSNRDRMISTTTGKLFLDPGFSKRYITISKTSISGRIQSYRENEKRAS